MDLQQIIIVVHVLIALAIIGLILLQQGKGADMGASFGAGSSQTVFGSAGGGNVLTRATALLSAAFFATSFALAIVAKNMAGQSVSIDSAIPAVVQEAPAVPESSDAAAPAAADDSEIPAAESTPTTDTEIPGVDD